MKELAPKMLISGYSHPTEKKVQVREFYLSEKSDWIPFSTLFAFPTFISSCFFFLYIFVLTSFRIGVILLLLLYASFSTPRFFSLRKLPKPLKLFLFFHSYKNQLI